MSDLVKRLRNYAGQTPYGMMDEAADKIEALEAEIARHKRDKDALHSTIENCVSAGASLQAEIARLTAAIERTEANRNDILSDLDGLTVERDAIAAAAFEAAVKAVSELRHAAGRAADGVRFQALDDARWKLRALTPADAKAELDRMMREAKEEGMREAAELANTSVADGGMGRSMAMFVKSGDWKTYKDACLLYRDAILAHADNLK